MEHMMLLVTYRMLPGQRDAFLQEVAAAGILAKVQQEDGFERYDYYPVSYTHLTLPTKLEV